MKKGFDDVDSQLVDLEGKIDKKIAGLATKINLANLETKIDKKLESLELSFR